MEVAHLKTLIPTYPKVSLKQSEDVFEKNINLQSLLRKYIDGTYYLIPVRHMIPFTGEIGDVDLTPMVQNFHRAAYETLITFNKDDASVGQIFVDDYQGTEKERIALVNGQDAKGN